MKFSRLFVLAGALASGTFAYSQAHWTTVGSGVWSTGTNWFGGSAPTSGDVYIDYNPYTITGGVGSFTTTLDYNVNLANLYTRAGFNLNGRNLSMSGSAYYAGPLLLNTGNLVGGHHYFNGAVTATGSTGVNSGIFDVNGTLALNTAGNIYAVNSTWNIAGVFSAGDSHFYDGIINITPSGVLRKNSGGGSFAVASGYSGGTRQINNAGLIQSTSGRLEMKASGTHTGKFEGAGGTVAFVGEGHTFLTGSEWKGGVALDGTTANVAAGNDLKISGTNFFNTGIINGGAGSRLTGTGILSLSATSNRSFQGTNIVEGPTVVLSGGDLYNVNSTTTNRSFFEIDGARDINDGIFINEGSIEKYGTGTARIARGYSGGTRIFNNYGNVLCSEGILQLFTDGEMAGSLLGAGGIIQLVEGEKTVMPGNEFGSGVQLTSGVISIPVGNTLNTSGNFEFVGGTIRGIGASAGNIGGAGQLVLNSTSLSFAGTVTLTGQTNWLAGTVYGVNATQNNSGNLTINTNDAWRDGIINNSGTITKNSNGITSIESYYGGPHAFNNSGTVNVNAGTMNIRHNGVHTGQFIANGGQITFPIESQVFNTGSKLIGNVQLNGTAASIPAGQQLEVTGTTWSNGNIQGPGTIVGAGPFNWVGTAGTTIGIVNLNVPVLATNSTKYFVNSTVNNYGSITLNTSVFRDGILNNFGSIKSVAGDNIVSEGYYGGTVQINNKAQIEADGSIIRVKSSGTHTGSFRTSNGGIIRFDDGTQTFNAGSILGLGTVSNTVMETNQYTEIENETIWQSNIWRGSGTLRGTGTWRWQGGSRTLQGSLTSDADINQEAGITYGVNATFTNNGTWTMADGTIYRDGILINNGKIQKIAGAGTSILNDNYYGGTTRLTNNGELSAQSGTLRSATALTNYNGSNQTITGGTYRAGGGGKLQLPIGAIATNVARIILSGPTSSIVQNNGSTSAIATLSDNRGGLELTNGANLALSNALTNSGDILIGSGSSLSASGGFSQTDGITSVNGTFPQQLLITGGVLGGVGVFNGAALSNATLAPGNSVGTLTSNGNLNMNFSTLKVEIASSGTGMFDRINVNGIAAITGGTLLADAAPNSTVPAGTTVDVLTATSRAGTFTTIPNPADWTVAYGSTYVRLTSQRSITGPVKIEGTIDLDRYASSYTNVPITFELQQGGNPVESFVISPFADRTYAVTTRRRGTFDLVITGPHWLVRRYPSAITLTDAGVQNIDIEMINGDIDQDNEVGPNDFSLLASSFGTQNGDSGYNPYADLDGDDEIGPGDFSILTANFGQTGD